MDRATNRKLFMQMLFSLDAQNDFTTEGMERFLGAYCDDNRPDESYFKPLFSAIQENLTSIDESLSNAAEHWSIGRFDKVNLAILRLAVAEMRYMDDIPEAVSINEAVELAKKFGTEDSPKFVNGVLGKISRESK